MVGYLLDTNVVSELARPKPDQHVLDWIANRPVERLNLSAITIGELTRGVERLAAGRTQDYLRGWVARLCAEFSGRILAFDETAGRRWGSMLAVSERAGRPRSPIDLQIAAMALDRDLMLVTRDDQDFLGLGVRVVDPWQPVGMAEQC